MGGRRRIGGGWAYRLVLAGLLIGVPVALAVVAGDPRPGGWPSPGAVSLAMRQRYVPGEAVIELLVAAMWLIWLQLAWAAVWELAVVGPRLVRGIHTRRAPLVIGPLGDMVARLVSGAVSAGLFVGASAITVLPVGPLAATAVAAEEHHPIDRLGHTELNGSDRVATVEPGVHDDRDTLDTAPAVEVTVTAGDSLWSLARGRMEVTARPTSDIDVARYVERIVAANPTLIVQPDLIFPGQRLTLPAVGLAPTGRGPAVEPGLEVGPPTGSRSEADPPLQPPDPPRRSNPAPPVVVDPRLPVPEPAMDGDDSAYPTDDSVDPPVTGGPTALLTAGGILAAGIVGLLTRRRRYRLAMRRPGTVPPDPPAELESVERALHTAADRGEADWWRAACRSLVARSAWPGEVVPAPLAVWVDGDRVITRFDRPDPAGPPHPWTTDDGDTWQLPRRTPVADLPVPEASDPLPAVAMVADGVAVNLEAVGLLAIDGAGVDGDAVATDVARSMLHQLAFAAVSGDVELKVTAAAAHRIGTPAPRACPPGPLAADLATRLHDGVAAADQDDGWRREPVAPTVVAFVTADDLAAFQPLLDRLRVGMRGAAVVAIGAVSADLPSHLAEWRITVDGERSDLRPLGLVIEPLRLGASAAGCVARLLDDPAPRPEPPVVDGLSRSVLSGGAAEPSSHSGSDGDPAPVDSSAADAPMVRVLGSVGVDLAGVDLTPQQLSLVAFLACAGPATKPMIVDALWDGRPVSDGRFANLLAEVRSKIGRRYLPDARNGHYELDGLSVDLREFEVAVRRADDQPAAEALVSLGAALELVGGVPLTTPGGRYWSWVGNHSHRAARLESMVADTAHRMAVAARDLDDLPVAAWACERGLTAAPLDEPLTVLLIEIYRALGRSGAAGRLVDAWEDGIRRLGCGEPSAEPRRRLAERVDVVRP